MTPRMQKWHILLLCHTSKWKECQNNLETEHFPTDESNDLAGRKELIKWEKLEENPVTSRFHNIGVYLEGSLFLNTEYLKAM